MCRLYAFRANEQTKVECTLVHAQNALLLQSRADSRGTSHADGWGLSVYHDSVPEVYKRASTAYEDFFFNSTAERLYSNCVVAHVRNATIGRPDVRNCHPFTYHCWSFAHNGTLFGFEELERRLAQETGPALQAHRRGVTDSEQAFVWLLSRMARAGISPERVCPDPDGLREVVAESVRELAAMSHEANPERPAQLNFILTDGHTLVASRWNHTLFRVVRDGIRDCEICGIPHVAHHEPVAYRAIVIASEPISDESWEAVPNHSVISVNDAIELELRRIDDLAPT